MENLISKVERKLELLISNVSFNFYNSKKELIIKSYTNHYSAYHNDKNYFESSMYGLINDIEKRIKANG